ncbi:MAG: flavin monoamine oxidase family protein, partial [Marmoricola sp.]
PTVEFTVGSYQPDGRPIAYYAPDGLRLSDAEAARFAADIHDFDERLAVTIAAAPPATSYQDVVELTLAASDWNDERRARVREYLRHRTEEQYGVWIADLDAHGLDDDQVEGEEVVFPHGYDELASHLAQGLDVRLGQVVDRVRWSDDRVVVECQGRSLTALCAVVTVPVGVLKSDTFMIEPALPEPVGGALEKLRMNHFEKVFLTFAERFWEHDVDVIRRQGPAGEWWHSWYDLTRVQGVPTLLTFAAGPCAEAVRSWSDEAIGQSVMSSLREIYGDRTLDPERVQVTRWQDEPFSRGSYAYMTVGSTPEDHDLLATPIGGVLHLAGEATWTEDPATVTAALRSGHRAAENVLGREIAIDRLWVGVEGIEPPTSSR